MHTPEFFIARWLRLRLEFSQQITQAPKVPSNELELLEHINGNDLVRFEKHVQLLQSHPEFTLETFMSKGRFNCDGSCADRENKEERSLEYDYLLHDGANVADELIHFID